MTMDGIGNLEAHSSYGTCGHRVSDLGSQIFIPLGILDKLNAQDSPNTTIIREAPWEAIALVGASLCRNTTDNTARLVQH